MSLETGFKCGWCFSTSDLFWKLVPAGSSRFQQFNASNLFSRCIGGCRIPVLTSLVIAVSGVEDATAAIRDTRDNLVSREPLGLAPCLCHRLVRRSVSACSSTLGINCWDSLDSQDSPAVCWGGPWWPSAVCSVCFGSPANNFVSRTTILCRSLWQFVAASRHFLSSVWM